MNFGRGLKPLVRGDSSSPAPPAGYGGVSPPAPASWVGIIFRVEKRMFYAVFRPWPGHAISLVNRPGAKCKLSRLANRKFAKPQPADPTPVQKLVTIRPGVSSTCMRDFAHQKRVSFLGFWGVLATGYSQGPWTDFDAKYAKTRRSAQGCAFSGLRT